MPACRAVYLCRVFIQPCCISRQSQSVLTGCVAVRKVCCPPQGEGCAKYENVHRFDYTNETSPNMQATVFRLRAGHCRLEINVLAHGALYHDHWGATACAPTATLLGLLHDTRTILPAKIRFTKIRARP